MKTQVNHQTGGIKYLTLVLAVGLFLIVFLSNFKSYKADYQNNYIEQSVRSENSITAPVAITEAYTVNETRNSTQSAIDYNPVVEAPVIVTENIEQEIVLTDWMLDASFWVSESEMELDVVLADWMVTKQTWMVFDYSAEELIVLEDWMLDTAAWELTDHSLLAEERDEIINIQDWMVNQDAWLDCNNFENNTVQTERLLTVNNPR